MLCDDDPPSKAFILCDEGPRSRSFILCDEEGLGLGRGYGDDTAGLTWMVCVVCRL
jgi:hypothetical protein